MPTKKPLRSAKATKGFLFTPTQIQDELTDRIEQGWSNDRIVAMYGDECGPRLRQWLTNRRRKLAKFWDSMGGGSYYD